MGRAACGGCAGQYAARSRWRGKVRWPVSACCESFLQLTYRQFVACEGARSRLACTKARKMRPVWQTTHAFGDSSPLHAVSWRDPRKRNSRQLLRWLKHVLVMTVPSKCVLPAFLLPPPAFWFGWCCTVAASFTVRTAVVAGQHRASAALCGSQAVCRVVGSAVGGDHRRRQ